MLSAFGNEPKALAYRRLVWITATKSFIVQAPFLYGPQFFTREENERFHFGATTVSITTFSITTFSIKTLSIMDVIVILSMKNTQHNDTRHKHLVSLCWLWLCRLWLCWVSLCWVSLCRVSLCWVSLYWVSWRLPFDCINVTDKLSKILWTCGLYYKPFCSRDKLAGLFLTATSTLVYSQCRLIQEKLINVFRALKSILYNF